MDVQTFTTRLKELSLRYKEWWYPSFNKFRVQYSKQNPGYKRTQYLEAFREFEANLRSQNDLVGEIFDFLDQNYEVYLNATAQEREEIRKTISNIYNIDDRANVTHFLEDLFMRYVKERAIPSINASADKVWLTRGLVAMSMENSGIDYRDSILALSELRKAAIEKNIDPQPEFSRIAQISSNEEPRGGSFPMRQLMEKSAGG